MSHSSGIGQDVHEATNGSDTSDTPDTCNGTGIPASTSQVEKCREGLAYLEQDEQRGTVEILMHPPHSTDPVCSQNHTNSSPQTHTHVCHEGFAHTDELEHTSYSQSVTKDSLYLDTGNQSHTHTSDVWERAEEAKSQSEERDDLKTSDDEQQTTFSSVQVTKETLAEESTTSQIPLKEETSSSLTSHIDGHSSASTPPDQAPPLVPAPLPSPGPPPVLPEPEDWPRPVHVMAEVRVRSAPGRERIVRGMQDSKSLDGISEACGGGTRAAASRGGQVEGRRATISSALELEGTVSHDGDLTNFITKNLEQKIKMSSRPSLDTDSDCSGPVVRGRGSLRRPADIPPIDPSVLVDLHKHTQEVAHSVEMMLRSLNGTIQNMTALSVGYIQTYRDSVDSLGESVDMSIKGMYTLMARCEELDRSMQPIQALATQIRDIKRTLDTLEGICK